MDKARVVSWWVQPELLLFVHHPSSGFVCLFVCLFSLSTIIIRICLFVCSVCPPSLIMLCPTHRSQGGESTCRRPWICARCRKWRSPLCCRAKRWHVLRNTTRRRETTNQPVKCKQICFCQTWEKTLNTAQVCTFGAKLCGFVCKDRAQHSIEHHYKADIASCIGSIIIMR